MAKSSKRQFLVKVDGIDGYFATKTGGEISSETTKAYDGGSLFPDVLPGPANSANIVVGRTYDPVRDLPVIKALKQQVGKFTTTVSQTPTDRDLSAVGEPSVWPGSLLVALREPDFDAASGDGATYELEFAVGSFR